MTYVATHPASLNCVLNVQRKEEYEPGVGPEFRRLGVGYPVLVLRSGSMITLRGVRKDKRPTDMQTCVQDVRPIRHLHIQ